MLEKAGQKNTKRDGGNPGDDRKQKQKIVDLKIG